MAISVFDVFLQSNPSSLLALLVPGFISIKVHELLVPSKHRNWGDSVIEAICFGAINSAAIWLVTPQKPGPLWFSKLVLFFGLFVLPVVWPVAFIKFRRSDFAKSKFRDLTPTSWDKFFEQRMECWVLIRLTNGKMVGGFWDPHSYASAFPNERDIYLSQVYKVNDEGAFLEEQKRTKGLWIKDESIAYIEFFNKEEKTQL